MDIYSNVSTNPPISQLAPKLAEAYPLKNPPNRSSALIGHGIRIVDPVIKTTIRKYLLSMRYPREDLPSISYSK
jgi:hypothetical protein